MRIGLFTDAYYPDINGVVSSVVTLKEALEKLGNIVYVITNHKGIDIQFEDNVLRLPGLELKRFYGYKISSPIQFSGIDYVKDMKLDIIHVQTEAGIGMFARQMARMMHIPLVYTYHTMYEDYTHYLNPLDIGLVEAGEKKVIRQFSKLWVNRSAAVIAPSEKTKNRLISYGAISPIYVIPTGLDLSAFDRNALDVEKLNGIRASVGLSDDDHIVTFVGRIAKEKAIEIPIKAMTLVKDEKMHLVIVGKGTDLNYYQNLVNELDLGDRVHFTGMVPKEDVSYYYSPFDCFVSASVSETQGMTYIEALASGLCVFGRRDEVLEDLVDEGITGYYFDDEVELATKLDAFFMKSKEERDSVRNKCIEKTIPYDTELFAKKVYDVYSNAIEYYKYSYVIEKTVDANDFVKLYLRRDFDKETKKILIPLAEFFELKIEINSRLNKALVDNYSDLQDLYVAYGRVKNRVLSKDYTIFEIKRYCIRNLQLNQNDIDAIIEMLMSAHLLDDRQYALDKAQLWHSYGKSKRDISNKLRLLGVDLEYVEEAISLLDDEIERNNALNMADKLKPTVSNQSNSQKRQTIIRKLVNKGFSFDVAKEVGESLEFDDSQDDVALYATIKKAMRMYSHFDEDIKRDKIRIYCLRKGFSLDKITDKLEEIEND